MKAHTKALRKTKNGSEVAACITMMNRLAIMPHLGGNLLEAMVAAIVRAGMGPAAAEEFRGISRSPDDAEILHDPKIADMIEQEMARQKRVDHLLTKSADGSWTFRDATDEMVFVLAD